DLQATGTAELSAALQRSGGFTGAVTLTLLNPPMGLSAAAVTVPAGASTAKLSLKTDGTSVAGDDTLTFAADAGTLHKTVQVKINVAAAPVPVGQAALTLVATPGSLSVKAGVPTTVAVKVTRSNVTGPVTLHLANLPINVTAADVVIPDGQDSAEMTLAQNGNSPAGSSTIQLQASSDTVKTSLNLPLTVESAESLPTAPTVSATSPASDAQSVNSAGLSVGVTFSQGMKSDVAKTISITPNVANFACLVNDGSVEIQQVNCAGDFQPGVTYIVTVATTAQNAAGVALAQPYSFSFKTAAQANPDPLPQSLTLSSTTSSLSIKPSAPATLSVKVQRKNFTGPVKLHANNLPANVTAPDVVIPDGQDSATVTLTQTGSSPAGTSTIQIQASAGNVSASLNLPLTVQSPILIVTTPKVIASLPTSGQQQVDPAGLGVMVKFSEPMQASAAQAITLSPVVPNLKCNIVPNKPETVSCTGDFAGNTSYAVTMSTAAKSTAGVALAQPYTFSFKTAPAVIVVPPSGDTTPPKVTSFTPTNSSIGVAHSPLNITVNFNEAMNKTTTQKAFQLLVPNVTDSKKSFSWNAAGTVMTMTYNEVLPYGSNVVWGMSSIATDLAGNPLAQANSVGGSYRLVRQATLKLYSEKDWSTNLMFNVENNEVMTTTGPYSQDVIGRGKDGSDRYIQRAFLQFDIGALTDFSKITKINSAILNIYTVLHQGNPQVLGDLDAVNINTPNFTQDSALWNAPVANSGQNLRHIYQGSGAGYNTLDITVPFTYNVKNPGLSAVMSQWRIQREFDNYLSSQDFNFRQTFIGSERMQDINKRPYIQVTYEYP
ncbi:hypothetical protein FNU79_18755, partial [Deinococcus detaillensis]